MSDLPAVRDIERLLVANRGEIARRIFRTASQMGISTVGVYAEADAAAPFVREASLSVALGGRTATDTYLNIAKLIDACAASGADAVHPGYGFLSERAAFARAVLDAGLIWVGPPPAAIDAMGDKLSAKRLMAEAEVPVLPSVEISGPTAWRTRAIGLRFPLLVKASAGGGGRGMRVVLTEEELDAALESAQREAMSAFGDSTVFLERYLPDARHVEVQVLADEHNNYIHCFERDCSVQRRHQKLIEEAPSPALDDAMRARMGEAALAAIRAVNYRNAGTVEFIVEPDGQFWFLEVNTRLQVEHPVTEAVTGLDLVREQLRIACGHPLSVRQEDLRITGHAVEARIYAEDPAAGFLPATGELVAWAPAKDPGVRVDSGVETGSVVGVDFDPMLAKVIAHAPTRSEAVRRLALALERSIIRGPVTNRDFLVATLRHPTFLAGKATTAFVETSGVATTRPVSRAELEVAAVGAALCGVAEARPGLGIRSSVRPGWRNSILPPESVEFEHITGRIRVGLRTSRDGSSVVTVNESHHTVRREDFVRVSGVGDRAPELCGSLCFAMDGRDHTLQVGHYGQTWWLQGPDGDVRLVEILRFPEPAREAVAGGLIAPMNGSVLSVQVRVGQVVVPGDLLMVIEAMKMEHRITASVSGTVRDIRVAEGEQVAGGDVLVVLDEEVGR